MVQVHHYFRNLAREERPKPPPNLEASFSFSFLSSSRRVLSSSFLWLSLGQGSGLQGARGQAYRRTGAR